MKRLIAPPQSEFFWLQPEPFRLVTQTALDGQRISDENARREMDKAEAEKQQLQNAEWQIK